MGPSELLRHVSRWGVAILAAVSSPATWGSNLGVDMTTPGWKPTPHRGAAIPAAVPHAELLG